MMIESYDSKSVQEKVKKFWQEERIYKFDEKREGEIFSIDTPPPTLSGKMHIGHAMSYSQQDFIARYKRMSGKNVFYPFGTDDNGLPTERMVEKMNRIKSKNMKREEFIKICLKTLKEITPEFVDDWKNVGISCDYDLYYSTIDEISRKIAQKSFIELYKKGLIYKKEFPTLWCTECQTSVAQAELEDKDQKSTFYTIRFMSRNKELLVATTRPELLMACVAVFVNPHDKRYEEFIGKKAKVPLFNHEVKIISDESAKMDKGTGVLMVCSYGDKYDVEAVQRHKLVPNIILRYDGKMSVEGYKGLSIIDARKMVAKQLEEKGLVASKRPIEHSVNTHDKCGSEIEFLTTEQWFIKVLDRKKELVEQGNRIRWHPEFMHKRFDNWVNGLEWDWNISRDRHFGVPIPVWECINCREIIIAEERVLPVDPTETIKKCKRCRSESRGEVKVFDTWMTSSHTPQIASVISGSKTLMPFSLRPQSHDIIRTWLFYTVVKALYHEKKKPWDNVIISGFVTAKGEKMSKSKGNVVSPQEVMEKYSADALRYWASGTKLGEDLDYQEKDLLTGKRLETKLWNAAKFVFMNLDEYDHKKQVKLEKIDEYFLARLNMLVNTVTKSFENYEYSKAKLETEKFFWQVFCDNYLEIVKKRLYENRPGKGSAQYTLYNGLLTIIKLISPIMPFITEEIYQKFFKKNERHKSVHISAWPEAKNCIDPKKFDMFIEVLTRIRQEKSANNKSMRSEIILWLTEAQQKELIEMLQDLLDVANVKELRTGEFRTSFV